MFAIKLCKIVDFLIEAYVIQTCQIRLLKLYGLLHKHSMGEKRFLNHCSFETLVTDTRTNLYRHLEIELKLENWCTEQKQLFDRS